MQYRDFGNTGVKISALGLGAMRLPEIEKDGKWYMDEEESLKIIHKAFELGVNYIDTAYGYCHGNSEYIVGKAIKGCRDKIYLSTKMPTWLAKQSGDYRRFLEEQLKKLDTSYIDFYHFHSVDKESWENTILKYNLLEEARQAKEEGLVKHLSFSFHDKPEVMKEIADTGLFQSVLCQYNLLDRSNEEAISYVREKGLGTVVMGPVAGGRLAAPSNVISQAFDKKVNSTPEIALRFVLGNPDVCCALSGMSSVEMVEENARVASIEEPLTENDWNRINKMLEETKRLAELYCTGCDYCLPCPQDIKISAVFKLMINHKVYELTEVSKKEFERYGKDEWLGAHPSSCIECGICETRCPQKIGIRKQLKQVISELC